MIGTWTISVRSTLNPSANKTTTGRNFPASPISANQTSPCLGFVAIKKVQYFLLNLTVRQHVAPLRFFMLPNEEPEIVQQLALHRFGLSLDFFDQ